MPCYSGKFSILVATGRGRSCKDWFSREVTKSDSQRFAVSRNLVLLTLLGVAQYSWGCTGMHQCCCVNMRTFNVEWVTLGLPRVFQILHYLGSIFYVVSAMYGMLGHVCII